MKNDSTYKPVLIINKKIILIVIASMVLLPIIINALLALPFPPTPGDLGNSDWLAFWGSFLGGCFGGVTTLIAVYYTLKQNLDNHSQIIEEQQEKNRLEVLPFLDIKGLSYSTYTPNIMDLLLGNNDQDKPIDKEPIYQYPSGYLLFEEGDITYTTKLPERIVEKLAYNGFATEKSGNSIILTNHNLIKQPLSISNIGINSAINVTLDLYGTNMEKTKEFLIPPFHMKADEKAIINFIFEQSFQEGDYAIQISFYDIYEKHRYTQDYKFTYSKDPLSFSMESISAPMLYK